MRAPRSDGPTGHPIAVIGATGHTGEYVVTELTRRGWPVILAGPNRTRLEVLHPGERGRLARVG